MNADTKCCAVVPVRKPLIRGPHMKPCPFKMAALHEGKPYCGMHYPPKLEQTRLRAKRYWYARRLLRCPD